MNIFSITRRACSAERKHMSLELAVQGQDLELVVPGQDLELVVPGQDLELAVPGQDLELAVPGQDLELVVPGQDLAFEAGVQVLHSILVLGKLPINDSFCFVVFVVSNTVFAPVSFMNEFKFVL